MRNPTPPTPERTAPSDAAALDPEALRAGLERIRLAGMPGVYAEVRDAGRVWRGATGVADLESGRPVSPDLRQRIGSVTKTFTAAAVMLQVERGIVGLDAPVGDYLPELVPGDRSRAVTVRMLLGHISGIADYLPYAFPSLRGLPSLLNVSPRSLDDNRHQTFDSRELIALGLAAPATGEPGGTPGVYSNTNYLLLGELLARVTGLRAEAAITRDVIEPAGLRDTAFPDGHRIDGPHPRMYEAFYGLIDPPKDYSVYTNTWVPTGAGLISTVEDLNTFYARLLAGSVVSAGSLAEMQRTSPVIALDGSRISYGLGLHKVSYPGHGTFWGHDGTVWGALTVSLTRADGQRQLSIAMNLVRWNTLDAAGRPQPHPIDEALHAFQRYAACGVEGGPSREGGGSGEGHASGESPEPR